ncbi:hypothetical protein HYW11_02355 [Candidatus Peregrinibacteria bacterium]|nr:hypothetical protein [Candidatus Peregrinibacteria bacterium]
MSFQVIHPMGLVSILLSILFLILIFSLILATSLTREAAKPQAVGEAVYCYLVQSVGIVLMSIGAVPTLYSVLSRTPLQSLTYAALLFVFSIGGLIFLWHDYLVSKLPAPSRAVPEAIYLSMWKFIGFTLLVFSLLSIILNILLQGAFPSSSLALHGILALYGLVLWWGTQRPAPSQGFSPKSAVRPPAPARKRR